MSERVDEIWFDSVARHQREARDRRTKEIVDHIFKDVCPDLMRRVRERRALRAVREGGE